MILSVCRFAKYTFSLLDGVFSPKMLLPAWKGRQQQEALLICVEKANFDIHFWPRGTLVTRLNYGNVCYLVLAAVSPGSPVRNHVGTIIFKRDQVRDKQKDESGQVRPGRGPSEGEQHLRCARGQRVEHLRKAAFRGVENCRQEGGRRPGKVVTVMR
jgi:hypothetical protein